MRRRPAYFCTIVAVLMGVAVVAPGINGQARAERSTEVPLLDCDGVPCVDATIGAGHKVRMGIDTGNVNSVVDTRVAGEAGLQRIGTMPANAPAGMYRTSMPEVRVGSVVLEAKQALAMDLSKMIEDKQVPRVDGTLAYTAFHDCVMVLDFARHKLRVSAPGADDLAARANGSEKISLITFGNDGPPIVVADGFAVDGRKVTAQVDTMYTGSLLVYTASISKLALDSEAKTEKTEMFPLTDGGVAMRVARAKSESFDGVELGGSAPKLYFPTPGVHEPDGLFDATVGIGLFSDAVVTLDFHHKTISVRRARAVDPPTDARGRQSSVQDLLRAFFVPVPRHQG